MRNDWCNLPKKHEDGDFGDRQGYYVEYVCRITGLRVCQNHSLVHRGYGRRTFSYVTTCEVVRDPKGRPTPLYVCTQKVADCAALKT